MIKKLMALLGVAMAAMLSYGSLLSEWYADHHDNPLEMITVGDDKDIKIKDITGGYYRFRSANAELVKTEYGWKLVLYEGFIGGNGIHAKGNLIIEIAPGNNVNITPIKKDWAPSLCPYGVIMGKCYGINCTKNLLIYGAGSLTIFNLAMGNDGFWGNGIRCSGSELKVAGGCRLRVETAESVAIGGVGGDNESFSGTLSIINAAVETIGFVGTKGSIIIDHSIVNIMSQGTALQSWEKISIKDSCCSFIAKNGMALGVRGLLETEDAIIYAHSQNNHCVVSSYDASSKSGYGCVFGKGFYRFATNGGEDYAAIDSSSDYNNVIINGAYIETCSPGGVGVLKTLGRITMNSGLLKHRRSMDFKKDFFVGRELLDVYGLLISWNSVGIELGYSPEKIIGVFLGETLVNWLQKQSIDNPKGNSVYSINGLINLNGGTIISEGTDYGIYKYNTTGTHVINGGSLQGPIRPVPVDANGNELACVTNVISNGTAYEQVTSGWTAKLPKDYNTSSLFVDGEKKLYFWVPPDIGFYKPDEWSSPFFVTSDPDGTKPMSRINLGEPVYLKYGFKNLAGHAAMKGFFNSFTLNGETSFTNRWEYSTLKAGEWGCGDAYWRPTKLQNLPNGTYSLKCELDVTDKFKEFDEAGNVRTIMFTVGDADSITHTVIFDANNGIESPAIRLVTDGATLGELPVPTRSCYVFEGWYTQETGGEKISAAIKVTANVTYYARWRANTYTVRYHRNRTAADATVQNQSFTYDREQELKWLSGDLKWDNPGSTFAGWATSASGPVVYANGQRVKNLTAANGAVVHLYAVWRNTAAQAYTIRFYRNDGSEAAVTRSFAIGKNHALPWISGGLGWTNPSGCTFAGWATSVNGAVVYSNGQSVTNLATAQGAVVNLYAVWNYTVTLRRNTGSGDTTSSRVTMRYGLGASLPWFDSGLKWTRTGYTFAGWSTNATCAASYANGLTVTNLINTAGTLYAQYRPNTYTVRYHRNRTATDATVQNQSFTYDREQELKWLTNGLKWDNPGCTFLGWATNATSAIISYANGQRVRNLSSVKGAVVHLYAVWRPTLGAALEVNGRTITTGGNKSWYGQCSVKHSGASAVQSGDISHGESSWMETVVKGPADVSFWWKVSSEGFCDRLSFYVDDVEQDSISGDVDWTEVTFSLVSGTHTLKWVYSKDGSINRDSDCGWVDQLSITEPSYTIRFHKNDGTGTVVTRSFVSGKNHELPWVNGGLGWSNPVGSSIVGWSRSASATSKTWSNGQTVKDLASAGASIDLYLVWTPRPYTIRFHKNDGSGNVVMRSFASGKNHALPWINGGLGWATPIGYNIEGWARSSSAMSNEWSNGQTVSALASAGGIIDLYVVWRPTLGSAMDVSGRNVTSGGNTSWTVQSGVKHLGANAAQSGDISDGEVSWMKTVVEGPADVSFWWKVSSERNYDKLRFYVDDVERDCISGEVDWTKVTVTLGSGTHSLKWAYSKDGSVDRGSDCGWVDQLSITVQSYTIRFHKNDGSGTVVTRSFASGKNHELPWINGGLGWTNPSGCSIVGWSRSSSATSKTWSNGQTVKDLASTGSSVDLYVVWSRPVRSSAVFAALPVNAESAVSFGPLVNPEPELLPGYYCGELADGTGMYDLLVDEGGETGYVNIIFDDGSVLAEEVEVDFLGDIIIVTGEDGEMYKLEL